jgi:hypothetical protein
MLTCAEEFLLLAHDETNGELVNLQEALFETALAGAVLMDLAILNRIDTDLSAFLVLDRTTTGETLLDHALEALAELPAKTTTLEALDLLGKQADELERLALARLIERGILREDQGRILWVFETRRYPLIDGRQLQEVRRRIADLLFSDQLPDPRDIVVIVLARSCGLLPRILSEDGLRRAEARIAQLSKLDLIGQSMSAMMTELSASLTRLLPYS